MKAPRIISLLVFFCYCVLLRAEDSSPLRLGIVGLSHSHLHEVLVRLDRGDFQIVGVAERDAALREKTPLRKKVDPSLFYENLEEMLDKSQPEAVIVYEPIYDHLRVVEACAPRGIHVMVEKPLAVSMKHANRMAELARKNDILLLTNYETTWYDTNHEAYRLIKDKGAIGDITRMEVYDGHQGPVEIKCSEEFLRWLTDPVLNGGGAVTDFGCYGANLATWFFDNQKPVSVYAVLKHQKPHVYPEVDDDATIILEYPSATVQIMGSWNWPMNRKDMHIYGSQGYIYQDTPVKMRVYTDRKENSVVAPRLKAPYNDPFYFLKAAVRKEIQISPQDLSSLENNLIVVEILESAVKSAEKGKVIRLKK
jgi:predicted dehydrogenase